MTNHLRILISVVSLVALFCTAALPAEDRVLLGEKHVMDVSEHDTIRVGKDRGAFTGLQVAVGGSAVEFKRVVIHFENGDEQELPENRIIRGGGRSRVIVLRKGPRHVDKVVFYYEARSPGWKGAQIRLWGVR